MQDAGKTFASMIASAPAGLNESNIQGLNEAEIVRGYSL